MDIDEAIEFLRSHQPMPPDEFIDDALIKKYDEVRLFLLKSRDNRVVPLLLGSFGPGFGHGVFQLMDEVFRGYPSTVVVPALDKALSVPSAGRWWSLQIALDFPDRQLAHHFRRLLSSENRDERFFAAANLEEVYEPEEDGEAVRKALDSEQDPEITAVLRNMQNQ